MLQESNGESILNMTQTDVGPGRERAPEVLLFPYLPLAERLRVGPWELLPQVAVNEQNTVSAWVADIMPQLMDLYRTPGVGLAKMGCVARLARDPVGAPIDALGYRRALHRSVVAALLDGNPDRAMEAQGWTVATSDNALMYGH